MNSFSYGLIFHIWIPFSYSDGYYSYENHYAT